MKTMKTFKQILENIEINEASSKKMPAFQQEDLNYLPDVIEDEVRSVWSAISTMIRDRMWRRDAVPKNENEVEDKLKEVYKKWERSVAKATKELVAGAKKITYEE